MCETISIRRFVFASLFRSSRAAVLDSREPRGKSPGLVALSARCSIKPPGICCEQRRRVFVFCREFRQFYVLRSSGGVATGLPTVFLAQLVVRSFARMELKYVSACYIRHLRRACGHKSRRKVEGMECADHSWLLWSGISAGILCRNEYK